MNITGYRFSSSWVVNISHGRRANPVTKISLSGLQASGSNSQSQLNQAATVPVATLQLSAGVQLLSKLKENAPVPASVANSESSSAPLNALLQKLAVAKQASDQSEVNDQEAEAENTETLVSVAPESGPPFSAAEDLPGVADQAEPQKASSRRKASLPAMGAAVHMGESIKSHDPEEFARFWHELEAEQRKKDVAMFGGSQSTPQHGQQQGNHSHPHPSPGLSFS